MFERRLKILLVIIFAIAGVVVCRAVQLQIWQSGQWEQAAIEAQKRQPRFVDAQRGQILDRQGVPLAFDAPCIDAAVDYRAISLNEKWIKELARARLKNRLDVPSSADARALMLDEEKAHVKSDIEGMWQLLAKVSGKDIEEIEEKRQEVIAHVEEQHRRTWYNNYDKATSKPTRVSWYKRWFAGVAFDDAADEHAAAIDSYTLDVDGETKPQVILHNISDDAQMKLAKAMVHCPGLQLIDGVRRQYQAEAARNSEHVLGNMTGISQKVLETGPKLSEENLRGHREGEEVGGAGLERLAEPVLRGTRGEKMLGTDNKWHDLIKPIAGRDIHCTIDLNLQHAVADAFRMPFEVPAQGENSAQKFSDLHGAAVVLKIDGQNNEVLSMFSNPGFDLNQLENDLPKLRRDLLNKPLLNRATMDAFQPGSTVKTIIGSYAVTNHKLTIREGIECNGYLQIPDRLHPGKMIEIKNGYRCWTIRVKGGVAHHQIYGQEHQGQYGNPPGWLCLSDALERSCNVYFETVANRLGLAGTADALHTFRLGETTGIGISESPGHVPPPVAPHGLENEWCWTAGIGEGQVTATPIQMATVAATIARNGVWKRPMLLMGDAAELVEDAERKSGKLKAPDSLDLHLDPQAIGEVKRGMDYVVNHLASGTGTELHMENLEVAGKTGSAQIDATELDIPEVDEQGKPVHDPDSQGHPGKGPVRIAKVVKPGQYEWFRGTGLNDEHLAHAWFIGFAPLEHPRIAFCVLVEYGGSGGKVAGPVAKRILDACLNLHYLDATAPAAKVAASGDSQRELLHAQ